MSQSHSEQSFKTVYEFVVKKGDRLSRFYYSRAFGFVGFTLSDGTLFTLQP